MHLDSDMEPIRVACVRYLNTVPLIEGLEKLRAVTLLPTVPSRIAGMVASGEADVGLCSLVDATGAGEPLALLPAGMIGCDGPTLTVRLFSSVPLHEVRVLHADTDSHTSVALARLLLARLHGATPPVIGFDALGGAPTGPEAARPDGEVRDAPPDHAWPETVLLIGDKVITDAPPGDRYPFQMDLGEAWKELTGLPFVYAVWMCRSDRAQDPTITAAAAILDRQRRHNQTRLDWIVSRHAGQHRWPEETARRYLGSLLRFEIGERERVAAEHFLAQCAELGLVQGDPPVWAAMVQPALA
jgi:chorismate dehydratase